MIKKIQWLICLFSAVLMLSLIGCGASDESSNNVDINYDVSLDALDYQDAEAFEAALNNKEDVVGKTVRFYVQDYVPGSSIGINCQAGEHLNFISEEKLDVKAGDYVLGVITKKPSTILGSWKIPYKVLKIESADTISEEKAETTTTVETEAETDESIADEIEETSEAISDVFDENPSDELVQELEDKYGLTYMGAVNNDKTGNWRYALYTGSVPAEMFVAEYLDVYAENDGEVHALINKELGTTTRFMPSGNLVDITVHKYIDGEENDAIELFNGGVIASYWYHLDTGELESLEMTIDDEEEATEVVTTEEPTVEETTTEAAKKLIHYVLNTNSMKIHKPSCSSVDEMKPSNKAEVDVESIDELKAQGYEPCGRCKP